MIYIQKTKPPHSLLEFIEEQQIELELRPTYNALRSYTSVIQELDNLLFKEQKGICCYCMQGLSLVSNERTQEHFLPQSKFPFYEVNYYNFYLVCKDKGTNTGHCDQTKGKILISNYIGHPDCGDFFKYNHKGEIVPAKLEFDEWDKIKKFRNSDKPSEKDHQSKNCDESLEKCYKFLKKIINLKPEIVQLLATIDILNLNEPALVSKRKEFIDSIKKVMNQLLTEQACESEIEKYKNFTHENPKSFAGVAIYFIKERIKKLQGKR